MRTVPPHELSGVRGDTPVLVRTRKPCATEGLRRPVPRGRQPAPEPVSLRSLEELRGMVIGGWYRRGDSPWQCASVQAGTEIWSHEGFTAVRTIFRRQAGDGEMLTRVRSRSCLLDSGQQQRLLLRNGQQMVPPGKILPGDEMGCHPFDSSGADRCLELGGVYMQAMLDAGMDLFRRPTHGLCGVDCRTLDAPSIYMARDKRRLAAMQELARKNGWMARMLPPDPPELPSLRFACLSCTPLTPLRLALDNSVLEVSSMAPPDSAWIFSLGCDAGNFVAMPGGLVLQCG